MTIESDGDLHGLRRAGRVVALAIEAMKTALEPGMTTAELDAVGAEVYERYGARSAPQLAFARAASVARAGRPVNKIGRVVETTVHRRGFAVLDGLSGHGTGKSIHEPPTIPNQFDRRLDSPLTEGLVVTIEPIIAAGSDRIVEGPDGWTIRTADGHPAAHYEHTIVVTRGSPTVLTAA